MTKKGVAPTVVEEIENEMLPTLNEYDKEGMGGVRERIEDAIGVRLDKNTLRMVPEEYQKKIQSTYFAGKEGEAPGIFADYIEKGLAARWKVVDTYDLLAHGQIPKEQIDTEINKALKEFKPYLVGSAFAQTPGGKMFSIGDSIDKIISLKGSEKVIAFDNLMSAVHQNGGQILSVNLDLQTSPEIAKSFSDVVLKRLNWLASPDKYISPLANYQANIPKPIVDDFTDKTKFGYKAIDNYESGSMEEYARNATEITSKIPKGKKGTFGGFLLKNGDIALTPYGHSQLGGDDFTRNGDSLRISRYPGRELDVDFSLKHPPSKQQISKIKEMAGKDPIFWSLDGEKYTGEARSYKELEDMIRPIYRQSGFQANIPSPNVKIDTTPNTNEEAAKAVGLTKDQWVNNYARLKEGIEDAMDPQMREGVTQEWVENHDWLFPDPKEVSKVEYDPDTGEEMLTTNDFTPLPKQRLMELTEEALGEVNSKVSPEMYEMFRRWEVADNIGYIMGKKNITYDELPQKIPVYRGDKDYVLSNTPQNFTLNKEVAKDFAGKGGRVYEFFIDKSKLPASLDNWYLNENEIVIDNPKAWLTETPGTTPLQANIPKPPPPNIDPNQYDVYYRASKEPFDTDVKPYSGGTDITTSKEQAHLYSAGYKVPRPIEEYYIPKTAKILKWEDLPYEIKNLVGSKDYDSASENASRLAKKGGYDIVEMLPEKPGLGDKNVLSDVVRGGRRMIQYVPGKKALELLIVNPNIVHYRNVIPDEFAKPINANIPKPSEVWKNPAPGKLNKVVRSSKFTDLHPGYYESGYFKGIVDPKGNIYVSDANKSIHAEMRYALKNSNVPGINQSGIYFPTTAGITETRKMGTQDFTVNLKDKEIYPGDMVYPGNLNEWIDNIKKAIPNIEKSVGGKVVLNPYRFEGGKDLSETTKLLSKNNLKWFMDKIKIPSQTTSSIPVRGQ